MGFIANIRKDVLKDVELLKSGIDLNENIKRLKNELELVDDKGKDLINDDIQALENDIIIRTEFNKKLLKSPIPFFVIEDLYMTYKDYVLCCDYVLFTDKKIFFVDYYSLSKYNSIDINELLAKGDMFLKRLEAMSTKVNPDSFKAVFIKDKFLDKFNYIVVGDDEALANNRNIILESSLFDFIDKANSDYKYKALAKSKILKEAQYFIDNHRDMDNLNISKYANYYIRNKDVEFKIDDLELVRELKELREKIAYKERIPLKFIFDDMQIKKWLEDQPDNISKLNDLDSHILNNYGEEIIETLNKK